MPGKNIEYGVGFRLDGYGNFEKVLSSYANSSKKATQSTKGLSKAQRTQARIEAQTRRLARKYGMTVNDVSNGLQKLGYEVTSTGIKHTAYNRTVKNTRKVMLKAKAATQKFHMELLSVMFGAMQVNKSMQGLIQPVMQLTGVTEVWKATLITLLGPVLFPLASILYKIMGFIMGLNETWKKAISWVILVIFVLSGLLMTFAQMGLFVLGLNTLLMKLGVNVSLNAINFKILGASIGVATAALGVYGGVIPPTTAAMSGLSAAMMGTTGSTNLFTAAVGALKAALAPELLLIYALIAAIIFLVYQIVMFAKEWETISANMSIWFHKYWDPMVDWFKTLFTNIGHFFKKWFWDKPIEWVGIAIEWIKEKWNSVKEKASEIFTAIGDFFKKWFHDKPIEWIGNAVDWIKEKWNWLKTETEGILIAIGEFFKKWFWDKPIEWISNLSSNISSTMDGIKTKFNNILTTIGGWFKKWFWNKPKEWIDNLKNWINSISLPSWMQSIISKGSEIIGGMSNWLLGSRQYGGYIPQTGPYLLHKGETVVPAGGDTFSPNITINANISSDMDIKSLASKLSVYWQEDLARRTQRRGI